MRRETPLSDVQKLCDVHAALFHGKTREEQIANAERAVHASVLREERESKTRELAQVKGHPLWLFANENGAFAMLLEQAEEKIKDGSANKKTLESLTRHLHSLCEEGRSPVPGFECAVWNIRTGKCDVDG